jgi:hypothetical protein
MSSQAAQQRSQPAPSRAFAPARKKAGPKVAAVIGVSMTLAAVAASMSLGGSPVSNPQTVSAAAPATQQIAASTMAPPAASPDVIVPAIPAFAAPSQPSLYPPSETLTWQPPQKQCSLTQRKFYVAGNGTIRIHAGDYVSPAVVLNPYPQEVAFPVPRPQAGMVAIERIVVEGRASTVVMTSDLPEFRQVYRDLRGSTYFDAKWAPLRNC